MFYGAVINPGKPVPLVPHADGHTLHLSQCSLPASVKEKSRVSLLIKVGDEEPIVLCTLCAGVSDTVLLDQFISEYAELSVQGSSGPVHVTGYYSPVMGEPYDEDEEGEDGYGMHPMDMFGMDEDEDESDDEGESDEDESSEGDEDFMAAAPREPSVIIEDITDKEPNHSRALPAPAAAADEGKKRKAAEAAADEAAAKKQAKQQQKEQKQQQQKEKEKEQQQQQQKEQQKGQKEQQKEQQQQKSSSQQQRPQSQLNQLQALPSKKGVKKFENGFEIHSKKMGDPHGKLAKAGKQVKVKYLGRLTNGKVFDKTGNKPFAFRLGVGEVIKGWDVGVEGMRVGDVRKLVIPPQMGYGSQRMSAIPPNSTLEFEVELVDVK